MLVLPFLLWVVWAVPDEGGPLGDATPILFPLLFIIIDLKNYFYYLPLLQSHGVLGFWGFGVLGI